MARMSASTPSGSWSKRWSVTRRTGAQTARAVGEDGRHPVALAGELPVAEGVNAAMDAVEAANGPIADLAFAEAERGQLPARDHPVLPLRERRDRLVDDATEVSVHSHRFSQSSSELKSREGTRNHPVWTARHYGDVALTLVLGPANSAKAGEVLGAFAAESTRGAILVVPTAADADHYSRELAQGGAVLGSVLTFSGLAFEIAARAGYSARRLTKLQRERVLERALAATDLQALRDAATTKGFPTAAGELIAELERSLITPQRFAAAMRTWAQQDPRRDAYARDVAAIYQAYASALNHLDRVDSELYAWRALDALRAAPGRWGTESVFFYGFDDLHPLERDAIETLARIVGAEVTVSLTYEAGRVALQARAEVVEELRPLAERVIELPASAEHYDPDSRTALHHLERELFEPEPERIDPGRAIALLEAGGERAEAELAAAEVLEMLRAGVRGEEIAVVYRSLSSAAPLIERVFHQYGIAVAVDRQTALRHTALGRSLLALARCAFLEDGPGRAQDLLEYLRSPGRSEPPETVDRLEADVRRKSLKTMQAARARLGSELGEIDALRAAEDPAAELAAQARRLLAAPHQGSAPGAWLPRGTRRPRARRSHPGPDRARGIGPRPPQADRRRADRAARDARGARASAPGAGGRARHRPARDPRPALPRRARVRAHRERVPARRHARAVPVRRAQARARGVQRAAAAPARGRPRARAISALHERVAGDRAGRARLPQLRRGREPGAALAVPGGRVRAARRRLARAPPSADARRRRVAGSRCADRARARPHPRGRRRPARRRRSLADRVAVRGGARARPPPPDPVGRRARELRRLPGPVADRARAPADRARARPGSARPRRIHAQRDRAGAARGSEAP